LPHTFTLLVMTCEYTFALLGIDESGFEHIFISIHFNIYILLLYTILLYTVKHDIHFVTTLSLERSYLAMKSHTEKTEHS